MRVLISGVAGNIGFGVGRVLNKWGIFQKLYGIDILDDHPGSVVFDKVDIAPSANHENYIGWLIKYINKNKINVFIPTSEAEILVVSKNISHFVKLCKVLINDPFLIRNCLDKYKTLNFLGKNNVVIPQNGLIKKSNLPKNYPVITKPRRGQGSKNTLKVSSLSMLNKCPNNYVWQEYLTPENEEYTCTVYVAKDLTMRILAIKRSLIGGYTGKGLVVNNILINDYIKNIAKIFNLAGLYNIQLILTNEGPKLFEINPRLSSTLVFRDKLGFQDLRWWMSECLHLKLPKFKPVLQGTKIYRGDIEYIIQ
jgi:carbamoyl-phosphate synthase large subunit